MKRHHQLISAAAVTLFLGATTASADCREELEQLTNGISKDGSLAPLQEPTDATPQTGGGDASGTTNTKDPGELAKDGDAAPLQADPSLATSGEDAQAQSQGGATAAEQAAGEGGSGTDKAALLQRAKLALDEGDETGCMEAVDKAKSM